MIKKIVATSLVAATLIFSGCGDGSDGENRLETQQMLDNADYAGVIAKLESSASSNEDYLALATAYMGKAGYSLLSIISAITADDEDLISALGKKSSYKSNLDLDKAEVFYKKVVGDNTCVSNSNTTLSASQKDVCLYLGLTAVTQVASTVNLLVGDIDNFANENNSTEDYKLTASGCAMQYAFENNETNVTNYNGCKITISSSDVNFTIIDKLYRPIEVTVTAENNASQKYHYLMTEVDANTSTRQTVITSGYCSETIFTPRVDDYNSSLYACPINETLAKDENATTSMNVLVDALNGGLDSVIAATKVDDGSTDNNNDVQKSIDEFKCNVLDGNYTSSDNSCDANISEDISESQVIDYLNNQN